MTIDDQAYCELVELGRRRSRDGVLSVLQLIDDEDQRIALLINIALDLANGAAQYVREYKGLTHDQAIVQVVHGLAYGLDAEKALAKTQRKVSPKRNRKRTT